MLQNRLMAPFPPGRLALFPGTFGYDAGFALYIALQGLAVTGSIAYSLLACRRRQVPLIWIALGGVWAALNPFLWVLAFSPTKDILFGVFLLCF